MLTPTVKLFYYCTRDTLDVLKATRYDTETFCDLLNRMRHVRGAVLGGNMSDKSSVVLFVGSRYTSGCRHDGANGFCVVFPLAHGFRHVICVERRRVRFVVFPAGAAAMAQGPRKGRGSREGGKVVRSGTSRQGHDRRSKRRRAKVDVVHVPASDCVETNDDHGGVFRLPARQWRVRAVVLLGGHTPGMPCPRRRADRYRVSVRRSGRGQCYVHYAA